MGILGISLYNRFVNKMEDMTTQSAEQLLNQTAINLESYLRNMAAYFRRHVLQRY